MIKYMQCVRRRPEMSIQEFRKHWEGYKRLAQVVAEKAGAVRVTINTTLAVEQNAEVVKTRGTREPYDGVIEFCLERGPDAVQALEKPEAREFVEAMQTAQSDFIDLENSTFFFLSED
jgi:hypothetical protein